MSYLDFARAASCSTIISVRRGTPHALPATWTCSR